jgi:hypothetical protein
MGAGGEQGDDGQPTFFVDDRIELGEVDHSRREAEREMAAA